MKFEEETVKEQVITRIKQTNNQLLLKKIARLLDTEESDTFWTKLTAELRAEIEQDKNKGKHELDRVRVFYRTKFCRLKLKPFLVAFTIIGVA